MAHKMADIEDVISALVPEMFRGMYQSHLHHKEGDSPGLWTWQAKPGGLQHFFSKREELVTHTKRDKKPIFVDDRNSVNSPIFTNGGSSVHYQRS